MDPFEASPQQDPLGAKLCEERMPLMPWDLKSYLGKMSVLTCVFFNYYLKQQARTRL